MRNPYQYLLFPILLLLFISCTEAGLYGKGVDTPAPNRLSIRGQVCTDDPKTAGFPVKVIFLVDYADGPLFGEFDLEQSRIKALQEALAIHNGNEAFSFAVIGMGPTPRLLAPQEGYFTRNPGELNNAVASLALPQPCIGGLCRDYKGGLSLVRSLIESDMADQNAGGLSRTQYVTVLMTAERPAPLECSYECCDPMVENCNFDNCDESEDCTLSILRDSVLKLREDIEAKGAASFSLHSLLLSAETDPTFSQDLLQQISFAGAGRFEQFNVADAITLNRVGLLKLSSLFQYKTLLVTNMSAQPGLEDAKIDSDGDGLEDAIEKSMGTSIYYADSDGDGIGDLVETLILMNPTAKEDIPLECAEIPGPPYLDSDADHLNDCEELLLGTDGSLTDSDGDAIPDWIEVLLGTDYLRVDDLDDADWDGVTNGEEAHNHTDPRTGDATNHLSSAYRYDVTNEGLVTTPSISEPKRIMGVTILSSGEDTTAGLGTLDYSPNGPTLRWKDPQDSSFGPAVTIATDGEYRIESSMDVTQDGEPSDRWISVQVSVIALPPTIEQELLMIELSERQCISFTVKNIQLVETLDDDSNGGKNDVYVYFAEAPTDNLSLPGLFRMVHIPVIYHKETGREPSDAFIELSDEDFIAVGY